MGKERSNELRDKYEGERKKKSKLNAWEKKEVMNLEKSGRRNE